MDFDTGALPFLLSSSAHDVLTRPPPARAGRRELDQIAEDEAARYKAPTTWYGRLWDAIM